MGKWPRHGSTKCILHRDLLSHKLLFLSALCTVAITVYGSVGCWLATFSRQRYVANNMKMESTTGDRLFQVFKFIFLLFPKFSPYSLREKACHFLRKTGRKSLTCHVTYYRELNECKSQERDKFLRFLIRMREISDGRIKAHSYEESYSECLDISSSSKLKQVNSIRSSSRISRRPPQPSTLARKLNCPQWPVHPP